MENHEEYLLLKGLKIGDVKAFNAIYDRYWNQLFAIAYSRTKDIQTSEDIVQTVFANIWAKRFQLEIRALPNYLSVAVMMATIRAANRKKKIVTTDFSDYQEIESGEESVDDILQYKILAQLISVETNNLPAGCQLVFKYSRAADLSRQEIAEILEISPETVKNQIGKALRQLRKAIANFKTLLVLFK